MKRVSYAFQKTRQMGEAEAAYKVIPSLVLSNSNVGCSWVATGKEAETHKRSKRATEADRTAGKEVMDIEGMEGEWCEQWDMRDKYMRRDERLHHIGMAQYAKMHRAGSKAAKGEEEEETPGSDEDDPTESYQKKPRAKKDVRNSTHPQLFEVVCCQGDCCKEVEGAQHRKKVEIPTRSKLVHVHPGEPSTMVRRWLPSAVRSHQPKRDKNPISFFCHELMLYIPWGAAGQPNLMDISDDEVTGLYVEWEDHIEEVKKIIMPHLEDVQEARYWLEEAERLDLEKVGDELAAGREQENLDALLEVYERWELEEMADILHPDLAEQEEADQGKRPEKTMICNIELVDKDELCERTRRMDSDQRIVLDKAIKYFKDIQRARRNKTKLPNPPHLMTHGAAGVGKSHVINQVCQWGQHILQQPGDDLDQPYILKTAFMGTASANISGQTLTSTFGLGFNNRHMSMKDKERELKKDQFRNLVMVVIDEISMVKADMLYQLHCKLQEIKNRHNVPFGGVAIFAFGDLFQLSPVMGRLVFEQPSSLTFRDHYNCDPLWQHLKVVNLNTNHRQGKDKDFADMLNRMRVVQKGELSQEDEKTLEKRVRPKDHKDLKNANINLVCKRDTAHKKNVEYLRSIDSEEFTIKAINFKSNQKKF